MKNLQHGKHYYKPILDLKKAKLFAHSTNTLKMKHHTFVDMIQVPTGVKCWLNSWTTI